MKKLKLAKIIILACFLAVAAFGPASAEVPVLTEAPMLPVIPALATAPAMANLISFGDSLSDSGNVFTFTGGVEPDPLHYWQGRWSNNVVWSEQLADYMGMKNKLLLAQVMGGAPVPAPPFLFLNSAFGGAQTGEDFMSFLLQVQAWIDNAMPIPDHSLVTVWIGANDFLANNPTTPEEVAAVVQAAMTNITMGLTELCDNLGAKNIAVMNLPDLGATPRMNGTPEGRAQGRALSEAFNGALAPTVAAFAAEHPGVNFWQVDVFTFFDQLLADPAKYGFTDTTHAALAEGKTFDDAFGFVFWDTIHPTTYAHERVALQVYGQIIIGSADPNIQYIKTLFAQAPVLGVEALTGVLEGTGFSDPSLTTAEGRPADMMFGLMTVNMATTPSGVAEFAVFLPWPLPEGYSWFKYLNGEWIDFTKVWEASGGQQGAMVSADRRVITVRVMDNGAYDLDPTLGRVVDPTGGGLAEAPGPDDPGYSSSSSCFMDSLF